MWHLIVYTHVPNSPAKRCDWTPKRCARLEPTLPSELGPGIQLTTVAVAVTRPRSANVFHKNPNLHALKRFFPTPRARDCANTRTHELTICICKRRRDAGFFFCIGGGVARCTCGPCGRQFIAYAQRCARCLSVAQQCARASRRVRAPPQRHNEHIMNHLAGRACAL